MDILIIRPQSLLYMGRVKSYFILLRGCIETIKIITARPRRDIQNIKSLLRSGPYIWTLGTQYVIVDVMDMMVNFYKIYYWPEGGSSAGNLERETVWTHKKATARLSNHSEYWMMKSYIIGNILKKYLSMQGEACSRSPNKNILK